MAYDDELAERVRGSVLDQVSVPGHAVPVELAEKRMFGGLADAELDRWVGHGVRYARSLPPK